MEKMWVGDKKFICSLKTISEEKEVWLFFSTFLLYVKI